uniref:Spermine oxidase-like isoform X2 n=1 Tax=Diabrotica virgifera virgifera TaxID=50390 RepID=A0A6P7GHY5_DIAVI
MSRLSLIVLLFLACLKLIYSNEYHKIVIIGAGASGLAAGVRLLENDIDDFMILEAEPRIGGRVKTVNFDGANVDLGATYCDGQKGNIIYEDLQRKNLLDLLESVESAKEFYLSSRKNIRDFQNSTESYSTEIPRRFNEVFLKKYQNDPEKLEVAKSVIHFIHYFAMGLDAALTWNDLAANTEFVEAEGHILRWKENGYKIYLDVLTKRYPNPEQELPIRNKIHLNKEVIKITMDASNNRLNIVCSDASTYEAKHVIFTPSLGVLKAKANSLFDPRLPQNKLKAIENIGYGDTGTVFLKYETKWWGNLTGFNLLWAREDLQSSKEKFPEGPTTSDGRSWITGLYNIGAIPNTNLLLVSLSGDTVPALETMDEQILKNGIYYTLNMFLGNKFDIPKNPKLLRSNWYNNPNFRGSYSYKSMKTRPEDRLHLLEPITYHGRLLIQFAGEATNRDHYSSVHGAIESGYREADRLKDFLKDNKRTYYDHLKNAISLPKKL